MAIRVDNGMTKKKMFRELTCVKIMSTHNDFADNLYATLSRQGAISIPIVGCHGYTFADVTNRRTDGMSINFH